MTIYFDENKEAYAQLETLERWGKSLLFQCSDEEYQELLVRKRIWSGNTIIVNPNYEEEKAQERQALFEQEFFLTSLGYIRRNVNMANGSTKDFICDIVPALQAGLTQGIATPIITYNQPDFTQDITTEYLVTLQEVKPVTAEFLKECMIQLSNDFMPAGLSIS